MCPAKFFCGLKLALQQRTGSPRGLSIEREHCGVTDARLVDLVFGPSVM